MRVQLRAAVAAVGVGLAFAGPAAASSIEVSDGVLVYTAAPGETNETAIYRAYEPSYTAEVPNSAYVYTADEIDVGSGCAPAPDVGLLYAGVAYLCEGVTDGVQASLGDGNDFLEVDAPASATATVDAGPGDDFVGLYDGDDAVSGGDGNDEIYGGHGNDRLGGGDGNDVLHGDYGGFTDGDQAGEDLEGAGDDLLDGGPGEDRLEGNGGADKLSGGAGMDTAIYNARKANLTITLDGQPGDGAENENDAIDSDVEGVLTGLGDDRVIGSSGPDTITTGRGKDSVDPGPGEDVVDTGEDLDTIAARDGAVDKLGCGDAIDSAIVDDSDVVGSDCEQLDRPSVASAPAAPAVTADKLELRILGKLRSGRRAMRLAGRLVLPAGADRRLCGGSAVTVRVTATNKGQPKRRRTTEILGPDCTFSTTIKMGLRRGARVTARAHFGGTSFLAPASSPPVRKLAKR